MRATSIASLLIGIGLGFGPMYIWQKDRAPEVLKAMPAPSRLQQLLDDLKKNPGNFEVLATLGNMQFDSRQYSGAIDWYTKALAVQESDELRRYLGIALYQEKRVDDAITQFNKVLETDPANPDMLELIGVALLKGKNDADGAIAAWEKLIKLNPNYKGIESVRRQIQEVKASRP